MSKKERLFIAWHTFLEKWHCAKAYYYGSARHEKKMKKHQSTLLKYQQGTDGEEKKNKASFSIKEWIQQKRKAGQHKPAEE
ncbi:hypothetical protein J2S74_004714 [Evansella vedderi]|uniref:Uncharacterized protein n=1 Tax=Evansella vedderi TaxID=38282 RepID=A0ABU0A194_9BACI|nr:hypothetical protein [Evansella vedderi]MDQ0257256.1 hypothetical protein [Evansella vedderi]